LESQHKTKNFNSKLERKSAKIKKKGEKIKSLTRKKVNSDLTASPTSKVL
jgi:hypothetical protein